MSAVMLLSPYVTEGWFWVVFDMACGAGVLLVAQELWKMRRRQED